MTADPWLPDFIAGWYDELLPSLKEKGLRAFDDPTVAVWTDEMRAEPNAAAARLDEWVRTANFRSTEHRLYHALKASGRALRRAGMLRPLEGGSEQWRDIRMHWRTTGNLLRSAKGLLLPQHHVSFAWAPPRRWSYTHEPDHFEGFLRWQGNEVPNLVIQPYVLRLSNPVESLDFGLRLAAVPLIDQVTDFKWDPIDDSPGDLRFRVSLCDEHAALEAAVKGLRTAAEAHCDLVVFPELCFTPSGQEKLGAAIAEISSEHAGYPWLVLAGTAHTQLENEREFHNRAIVFDGGGRRVLHYDKLNPYRMSAREQTRYGLPDALNSVARTEDIVIPDVETMSLAETPIGRVGILICEDLSHIDVYAPVVRRLAIDWLLVPVLDGAQIPQRWTGLHARTYSGLGAGVFVVTSTSLVRAHRQADGSLPMSIGLLVQPGADVEPMLSEAEHWVPICRTLGDREE